MLYLRAFKNILKYEFELCIAPTKGDTTILNLLPLLIAQGISFKIVIDTGNIKAEIQKSYGIEDKFIYEVPIPYEFMGKMKGSGIEDLFTKNDFEKLLSTNNQAKEADYGMVSNSFYMKDRPKGLIAHAFLENCKNYKTENFDTETIDNFRKVLDFCKEECWLRI
jgi:hypothetical protein